MISVSFSADRPSYPHVLALPVAGGAAIESSLPPAFASAAAQARAAAEAQRFTGEAGSVIELFLAEGESVTRVLLVGTGEGEGAGDRVGSLLVARLLTSGERRVAIDLTALEAAQREAFGVTLAEAAALRSWRYDKYRTKLTPKQSPSLEELVIVVGDQVATVDKVWAGRTAVTEGVALARTLVTEPANIIYPESFVERCMPLRDLGVEIEVLDEAAMREAGMGALLGVSQGSAREARLLVMRWNGTGDAGAPSTAFVGKGVTFDTGGISLKPPAGMEDMKWDMGGAGAVAGLMHALAARRAPVHVAGICGLVENMPDGLAQRPGDVVTSMSGQTIEVINTDAEGRLVLCDAITWVQRNLRPKTIVDLATLTGAMIVSLGHEYGGLFANDDGLADAILAAGTATGEKLWRFPMGEAYDKLLESQIADMKNVGPRQAGSISAAQFIARFVDEGVRWAHLDIAGMVWAAKPGTFYDKGATGFGVRLLDRFVRDTLEG